MRVAQLFESQGKYLVYLGLAVNTGFFRCLEPGKQHQGVFHAGGAMITPDMILAAIREAAGSQRT